MIVGGQQRVRVRRQVDPDDLGALVHHMVDEAGVLVAEPVVVLAPDMARQQVVQARDRPPPRYVVGDLEPLGVLVDHRVDDVDERLIAVEQAVPTSEQVPLEPTLALVLGEHLDHPSGAGEVLVHLRPEEFGVPLLGGGVEHGLQAIGRGLVGAEDPEVVGIEPHHLGQPLTEHSGGFGHRSARGGYVHAVVPEVGQPQILQQQPTVGVRVVTHPQRARRRQLGDRGVEFAVLVEQFVGPVGGQPVREHLQMLRGVAGAGERNLVCAPGSRGLLAVDVVRAGPPLRGAEDDHRPARPPLVTLSGPRFDLRDLVEHRVEESREPPVGVRDVAVLLRLEEVGVVAVTDHQAAKFIVSEYGPAQSD